MRSFTLSLIVLLVMAATLATEVGAVANSRRRHYDHPARRTGRASVSPTCGSSCHAVLVSVEIGAG
jgi:hypothetical protein